MSGDLIGTFSKEGDSIWMESKIIQIVDSRIYYLSKGNIVKQYLKYLQSNISSWLIIWQLYDSDVLELVKDPGQLNSNNNFYQTY